MSFAKEHVLNLLVLEIGQVVTWVLALAFSSTFQESPNTPNRFPHEFPKPTFGMLVCPEEFFSLFVCRKSFRNVTVVVHGVTYRTSSVCVCSTVMSFIGGEHVFIPITKIPSSGT